jgi:DNA-binding Lrp family transcriptional regulator
MPNDPQPALDAVDRLILEALGRDARITNQKLADHVGVAPSTALARLRALRARGVVKGFHAEVDLAALGRPVEALVFAQVRPLSRDLIERFHHDALAMPEVMAVFVLAGGDDFLLHVGVLDVQQLHSFLVDRLSSRKEIVQFRSSIIFTHGRKQALENLRPPAT